jgi:hypothetical protein
MTSARKFSPPSQRFATGQKNVHSVCVPAGKSAVGRSKKCRSPSAAATVSLLPMFAQWSVVQCTVAAVCRIRPDGHHLRVCTGISDENVEQVVDVEELDAPSGASSVSRVRCFTMKIAIKRLTRIPDRGDQVDQATASTVTQPIPRRGLLDFVSWAVCIACVLSIIKLFPDGRS